MSPILIEFFYNISYFCSTTVARTVSEDVTGQQCQKRWQDSTEPNIKKGGWSVEEDMQLRAAVEVFGNSWADVALFVRGRTKNQCRERWLDRLTTSAKGKWNNEEDELLLKLVDELGTSDWKIISEKHGNGRTAEMVCIRALMYQILR